MIVIAGAPGHPAGVHGGGAPSVDAELLALLIREEELARIQSSVHTQLVDRDKDRRRRRHANRLSPSHTLAHTLAPVTAHTQALAPLDTLAHTLAQPTPQPTRVDGQPTPAHLQGQPTPAHLQGLGQGQGLGQTQGL